MLIKTAVFINKGSTNPFCQYILPLFYGLGHSHLAEFKGVTLESGSYTQKTLP